MDNKSFIRLEVALAMSAIGIVVFLLPIIMLASEGYASTTGTDRTPR